MPRRLLVGAAILLSSFPFCAYSQFEVESEYSTNSSYDDYYSSNSSARTADYPRDRTYEDVSDYTFNRSDDDDSYYRQTSNYRRQRYARSSSDWQSPRYSTRLPSRISPPGENLIVVDPRVHAWGAYAANGTLVRSGLASAGANWCNDIGRPCRTKPGSFRIFSLGDSECYSTRYPLPDGGAPMPYCMYFNNNQAIHGSNELGDANLSHGCVRVHVRDAEWIRFNFASKGTRVVVRPY